MSYTYFWTLIFLKSVKPARHWTWSPKNDCKILNGIFFKSEFFKIEILTLQILQKKKFLSQTSLPRVLALLNSIRLINLLILEKNFELEIEGEARNFNCVIFKIDSHFSQITFKSLNKMTKPRSEVFRCGTLIRSLCVAAVFYRKNEIYYGTRKCNWVKEEVNFFQLFKLMISK